MDASCLGVGYPGLGALPPPTARPLGCAAGANYPLAVGAEGVGVGTPHQCRARALASWVCARWGRHEGAWGGRLLPGFGVSGVGRSPTPDRSSFGACCRGPVPTGCGCGVCGLGTRHQPHNARSCELALRAVGAARGRSGGGASCLGVGRPESGALPPPTACPLGHAAGAHYPLAVGAENAGVGTRHPPRSTRSCELALCAVGAARGRPGGGPLAWVWGVRGGALPHPRPLVL